MFPEKQLITLMHWHEILINLLHLNPGSLGMKHSLLGKKYSHQKPTKEYIADEIVACNVIVS